MIETRKSCVLHAQPNLPSGDALLAMSSTDIPDAAVIAVMPLVAAPAGEITPRCGTCQDLAVPCSRCHADARRSMAPRIRVPSRTPGFGGSVLRLMSTRLVVPRLQAQPLAACSGGARRLCASALGHAKRGHDGSMGRPRWHSSHPPAEILEAAEGYHQSPPSRPGARGERRAAPGEPRPGRRRRGGRSMDRREWSRSPPSRSSRRGGRARRGRPWRAASAVRASAAMVNRPPLSRNMGIPISNAGPDDRAARVKQPESQRLPTCRAPWQSARRYPERATYPRPGALTSVPITR